MSRADYFRRQADTCLRLSLISSSEEVANRLIVMAQDYQTKADAIVGTGPANTNSSGAL
jgi:hypothetical protein